MLETWRYENWLFRQLIEVRTGAAMCCDRPVEVELDFTQALRGWGEQNAFSVDSIRVVEIDAGGAVVDDDIGAQFDRAEGYSASRRARGTLVFILKGQTPPETSRYFHVYYDTADGFHVSPMVTEQVTLTRDVMYAGQASYILATPAATYIYHTQGAGLASLEDPGGHDWIGYGPEDRQRGIPNLIYPEGHFHPGSVTCTSRVVSQGPVKVTVDAESEDRRWLCRWAFYPAYARLTVLRSDTPYWFMYEGAARDYVVRAPGRRTPARKDWEALAPAWVYFGKRDYVLYLIDHTHHGAVASYDGKSASFGFGRRGFERHLDAVPAHFTFGLAQSAPFLQLVQKLDTICSPLEIHLGRPEINRG